MTHKYEFLGELVGTFLLVILGGSIAALFFVWILEPAMAVKSDICNCNNNQNQ